MIKKNVKLSNFNCLSEIHQADIKGGNTLHSNLGSTNTSSTYNTSTSGSTFNTTNNSLAGGVVGNGGAVVSSCNCVGPCSSTCSGGGSLTLNTIPN